MSKERCINCRYLGRGKLITTGNLTSGPACRRHAPVAQVDGWDWPPVDPDMDWCGDFTIKRFRHDDDRVSER